MYSPALFAHASNPQNRGLLADANAWGNSHYAECSDHFSLSLLIQDGVIVSAGYEAKACGPVIAFGSLATEAIVGLSVGEALKLDAFHWDKLAGGLPPAKRHAILLFLDSLHQALTQLLNSKDKEG